MTCAAVAAVLLLSACASVRQSAPPDAEPASIDAELFRLVMQHAAAIIPLPRQPIRVDPRPLPGSPAYWYMRGPVFADSVSAGVIDERQSILAELGIAETDIERDSLCPANPHEESYEACPGDSYYALAVSFAWSGTEDHYEPCARAGRCVMRRLVRGMSPRGSSIAAWDYFFSWDAAAGRWVIDEVVNLYVT